MIRNLRSMDNIDELEFLFLTAPVGMAVPDPDLRLLRINEFLGSFNAKPIETLIGQTLEEVLPELAPQFVPWIQQAIETREPIHGLDITTSEPTEPSADDMMAQTLDVLIPARMRTAHLKYITTFEGSADRAWERQSVRGQRSNGEELRSERNQSLSPSGSLSRISGSVPLGDEPMEGLLL